MLFDFLRVLLGLAMVIGGAEWLVDGASSIARKVGISEFVIGLTIVGFGTSCPELVVSLAGALKGSADISLGNVVGSNIFNTLLILGLIAIITPISITPSNKRNDIPLTLFATILFVSLGILVGRLGWFVGLIFLLLFTGFIFYNFKSGFTSNTESEEVKSEEHLGLGVAIFCVIAGLLGLAFGGQILVDGATLLAREGGVSEKIIAVTLLAGGTSLPELVTCLVAISKHKDQLALGNILGSNVFNILLILGCSALVTPLGTTSLNFIDYGALLLSALLVWIFTFTGRHDHLDRWEGIIMLSVFVAYFTLLILF